MTAATKTRQRPARRAATSRPPRTRRAPAQSGPSLATIVTWGAFAFVGVVIAAGVAAILADDVPFEDRQIRDMRLRLRALASHAPGEALETLKRQFAELQNDVQHRIAHLR